MLLRVEPRAQSEGRGRLHWPRKSMGTAVFWSASVETPRVRAGNYLRPSTTEALREELPQWRSNRRSRPIGPLPGNPDCALQGPLVHEFLEWCFGSLPPTVSAKAGANCLARFAGNYRAPAPRWFANGHGQSHSSRELSRM